MGCGGYDGADGTACCADCAMDPLGGSLHNDYDPPTLGEIVAAADPVADRDKVVGAVRTWLLTWKLEEPHAIERLAVEAR